MAYGEFEDLCRRTASNKILQYKVFNIAKISKHDGYQRGLGSMVHKKTSDGVVQMKICQTSLL